MATNDNYLRVNGEIAQEQESAEMFGNLRSRKQIVINGQNGPQIITLKEKSSVPGPDGHYEDIESRTIMDLTGDGSFLPSDPEQIIGWTSSGSFIRRGDTVFRCTSPFHGRRNRNFIVGLDGRKTGPDTGICSSCQSVLNALYVAAAIIGAGIVFGIFMGAGAI